jgi:hypothetical protein
MQFAIEVEADNADALDILVGATERWLKSVEATILERRRDEEDCIVAFVVNSKKDLSLMASGKEIPGKYTIEPL